VKRLPFKSQAHEVLHRLGFDLVRFDGRKFPERKRAELMQELGTDLVIDIGANLGQYVREIRRNGFSGRIIAFEPLHGPFEQIAELARGDSELTVHRLALGVTEVDATINVAANSWSSSLLAMTETHLSAVPESVYVGEELIEIRPLDSLDLIRPDDVAWIKIDTQGSEASVLSGGQETLKRAQAVEIELTYLPLYEGQALAWEIWKILGGLGFNLVAFANPIYHPAHWLFCRLTGSSYARKGGTPEDDSGERLPSHELVADRRLPFLRGTAVRVVIDSADR
jgi:FkbM family methyltransferase